MGGVTIQDCYEENKDATVEELYKCFGEMAQYWARLGKKSIQPKTSIEHIRDSTPNLDPILAKLFDNFLHIWDKVNIELL